MTSFASLSIDLAAFCGFARWCRRIDQHRLIFGGRLHSSTPTGAVTEFDGYCGFIKCGAKPTRDDDGEDEGEGRLFSEGPKDKICG